MPIPYVRNVPRDLYAAIRKKAKENRRSMAFEVLEVLKHNIPTARELKARKQWYESLKNLKFAATSNGRLPSSEEMIREDRER
jgi:plasmid stability protein